MFFSQMFFSLWLVAVSVSPVTIDLSVFLVHLDSPQDPPGVFPVPASLLSCPLKSDVWDTTRVGDGLTLPVADHYLGTFRGFRLHSSPPATHKPKPDHELKTCCR